MSIRDTKEGRDLVGLGLKVLALADDATAYAAQIERDPHTSERLKAVVRDLVDPAKLAAFIASAARRMVATFKECVRMLLAATAPDPGPPCPADMADLARLVAVELRKRGIWAFGDEHIVRLGRMRPVGIRVPCASWASNNVAYSMYRSDFDNLTPSECADLIQREEAAKAAEWAGDK